jgi:SAM-dependent methyltransferase
VVAVEPSAVMRAQPPPGAAWCLAAVAERLPFANNSMDAAMSVLSYQHWANPIAGLAEMARVARRVVVFHPARFWLTRDYLPELAHPSQGVPTLAERAARARCPDGGGAGALGLRRRVLPRLLAPPARLPAARGPPG